MACIVEKIRTLIKVGPDINSDLEKISSSKTLFDAVLPIHNKLYRKKNEDKIVRFLRVLLVQNNEQFFQF